MWHPRWFIDYGESDSTVPRTSAQAAPAKHFVYVSQTYPKLPTDPPLTHSKLPNDQNVVNGVLAILSGNSPYSSDLRASPEQALPQGSTLYKSCSPIDISVTNSAGQTVSANAVQVATADYGQVAGSTQVVVPDSDTYRATLTGTRSGAMDFVVQHNDATSTATTASIFSKCSCASPVDENSHRFTERYHPTLLYDYASKSVIDNIPANSPPPTISCTICYFLSIESRATATFNVRYVS